MKKWKTVVVWLLILCFSFLTPGQVLLAEEGEAEQETEEPIPESYYYEIESNKIANWPQGPQIESASAVVMDLNSGAVLYSKQATETQYPASITKIMTTLLLIENCDLDETITFSEIVYDIEEGSSHLGIKPGEEMTLRDAAYGIMLASANDISNGVAEYISGSVSAFADLMNERAAAIGCVNTHFSNPHGLYSDDHYTCAYDMALIAREAFQNPVFREITGTSLYTIDETNVTDEKRYLLNHHKMIQSDEEYYQEWCLGGKNGYTSQCLNTLVTYGSRDGKDLVSVVLRVNGAGKAYRESTQILEYGFENFYVKNIEKTGSGKTFYDIIGLRYAGYAEEFQSSVWKREPLEEGSVYLILPNQADGSSVSASVEGEGNTKRFTYSYEGQYVGSGTAVFHTLSVPAKPTVAAKGGDGELYSGESIQADSLDELLVQTMALLQEGYQTMSDYTENHFEVVLAGGALLLVILLVFLIVLIFRCTANARIRRRRRLEELERQKREEEIERMTTAEIEAELRMGMEQERLRREREQQAAAEAERAAREAEEMEWKARETERLLEELERERQERMQLGKSIDN